MTQYLVPVSDADLCELRKFLARILFALPEPPKDTKQ